MRHVIAGIQVFIKLYVYTQKMTPNSAHSWLMHTLPSDEHPDARGVFTRYHVILPPLNANLMFFDRRVATWQVWHDWQGTTVRGVSGSLSAPLLAWLARWTILPARVVRFAPFV